MDDNALITLLVAQLQAGFALQNIIVGIEQANQPTQQNTPPDPTIFLTKVFDNRYGWVKREDKFNADTGVMMHTETEIIETRFQMGALATEIPGMTTLTAADYLRYAGRILQWNSTVSNLNAEGVGIYRIQSTNQTFFKNNANQFQASPILSFTVTHRDASSYEIGSTDTVKATLVSF